MWLALYVSSAGNLVFVYYAGVACRVSLLSVITLSSWTHVVITRQGSIYNLYINGVLAASTTYSAIHTYTGGYYACIGTYAVGTNYNTTAFMFKGVIKDAMIVPKRALSQLQIKDIINETFIY